MASTDTFETGSLNFNIKYENDIRVPFTVLNADATAYSFTNKTDSDLNIYTHNGGTLLKNIGESANSGLSYSSNVITWNDPWSDVGLGIGTYYYELTYEDSGFTVPTVKIYDGYIGVK